jgi:hypothetical protein
VGRAPVPATIAGRAALLRLVGVVCGGAAARLEGSDGRPFRRARGRTCAPGSAATGCGRCSWSWCPLLAAAALAYYGYARVARVEAALGSSLAGLADDAAGAPLDRRLERVRALAEEVKGLRPLPGQLAAERDARTVAEAELARVGGRVATLTGERDGLAAAWEPPRRSSAA